MAIPHEAEYRPGEEEPDLFRVANSRRGGKQVETEPPKVNERDLISLRVSKLTELTYG